MANPWKTLSSESIYENPWFGVRRDAVIRPDGEHGVYSVVTANRLAVGIVPLWEDGTLTLVGQYRYPIAEYTWEIPEGGVRPGATAEEGAQAELREETGITAAAWTPLGRCHLSNCFLDEVCHLFLARELIPGPPDPGGDEALETTRVSLQEALAMARDGRITDAISIAGLFRAHALLDGSLPSRSARRLDSTIRGEKPTL